MFLPPTRTFPSLGIHPDWARRSIVVLRVDLVVGSLGVGGRTTGGCCGDLDLGEEGRATWRLLRGFGLRSGRAGDWRRPVHRVGLGDRLLTGRGSRAERGLLIGGSGSLLGSSFFLLGF